MLLIILIILFQPPATSQDTFAPFHKSRVRDVASTDTTNIKEALLDKINKFSAATGNKFDQLETIENGENNAKAKEIAGMLFNSEEMQILRRGADPFVDTNFRASLSRKGPSASNSEIQEMQQNIAGTQADPESSLVSSSADKDLRDIRDWRMRFYKAFRTSRNRQRAGREGVESTWRQSNADSSKAALQNQKKIIIFENPQVGATGNDDWSNFMSLKNAQFLNERKSPPSPPVGQFGVEQSGYRYNTSVVNLYQPFKAMPPAPPPPTYYHSYQESKAAPLPDNGIPENPLYQPGNGWMHSPTSDYSRLPPTPNPRSTEASVHTVQIAPPPTAPLYPDLATNGYTPGYAEYTATPVTEPIQLLSEYDPNTYTTQDSSQKLPGMVAPPNYAIDNSDVMENDNFGILDEIYSSSPAVAAFGSTFHSDDRCNSPQLRTIITNNIVENDSESSKRAIQEAAENSFGNYYNVICGTGFFSYIAHTDEFCLVSMSGVNCYAFSPVCSKAYTGFRKAKASKTKSAVSKS